MLEKQKLTPESFILGFKHGLYIITNDTCHLCEDYKKEIADVNSCYLYFVEAALQADRRAIWDIVGRVGFPITAGFWKDELKFVKLGILYGADRVRAFKFLEKFPSSPLDPEELEKLRKSAHKKCKLSFYIFPQGTPEEARIRAKNESYEHDELPIDPDEAAKGLDGVPLEEKMRLFTGVLGISKLIIFNVFDPRGYSEVSNELIRLQIEDGDYGQTSIEYRSVSETAEASESDTRG